METVSTRGLCSKAIISNIINWVLYVFLTSKSHRSVFLKKAILGLHKNLFWHISRKFWKIFKRPNLKHNLTKKKYFQKGSWKCILFLKKIIWKRGWSTLLGGFCHIWPTNHLRLLVKHNKGQLKKETLYLANFCL